jgi:heme-degrading monooxygenase HmoA
MEEGTAYTLALWRVKEGREEEFVEAWKDVLGDFFYGLPNPPGPGTLIRSVEDPQLFHSFGPWKSLDDIRQMRSDPRTPEMIGKLAALCEEAKPGTFQVVATAP